MKNKETELRNAAGIPALQGFAMDGAPIAQLQTMPAKPVQSTTVAAQQPMAPINTGASSQTSSGEVKTSK